MSQPAKIILGAVILAILIVGGYAYMTQDKGTPTVTKTPQSTTAQTKPEQKATQTPEEVPVVVTPAPVETQNKLEEIQAKLTAGTITPEEAIKQMDAFNAEQAKKTVAPEMK